ncbi:LPXTG cell wall anchor domain-containing protein [Streptomyces mobaraensis NBRC 13819 = DSM 40847]|uniref:LPXTG-motif cell wall anchor domain-containing protein n=1 Tax=Streptomyces mobaraensis (strain ATCC 29032 / DSM 40847 / JCM 4168 / NBRC 13819 / NCIMB 11159 / IPCR 16-22) TaxID=1223523 RepID=M3ABC7_STRM1|nr:LPXTG cell wall anchor domain-containing protein [Streptomyces mobaraensis]EMF02484.1 LPXTG-motif cell wall anchor domain-containing protein [Streptomyces mobaraensis NBRC 13819 = DSM 40847]QTT76869.1 LPXTG cell wall anchor domain-containing protein [Streptomyces mobaraensis NBRC 13819 = DSM 40847]
MTQSVRSGRGAALPLALVGAALLSAGTAGLAFAGEAPAEGQKGAQAPLPAAAEAAAAWAAHQLDARSNAQWDHGLTADIVMGLASTGTAGKTAERATDFLEVNAGQFIQAKGKGKVNAGGTAKLALVAEIMHRKLKDFGGYDLSALLQGSLQKNGRFKGYEGDSSNQFTQSLGVLALQRAGGAPKEAVDVIAASECKNGGFPLALKEKPNPDTCTPHTDATGMAVQALLAAGRTAEAEAGLKWLVEEQQLPNGGFADTSQTPGAPKDKWEANANTTALAVQALVAGRRTTEADRGIDWLRSVQVACEAKNPHDRGAVGWKQRVVDGSTLRATAQAIPALARQPLADINGGNMKDDSVPMVCAGDTGDTGSNGGRTKSPSPSQSATTGNSPSPEPSTAAPSQTATATATPTATATSTSDTTTGGGSGGTGGSSSDTGTSSGTSTGATTGSGTDNASGSLARTGANTAYPVAIGAGALLLAGSAAVVVSRRRRRDDAG